MKQIENFVNATIELILFLYQNLFKLVLAGVCLMVFTILLLMLLWFVKCLWEQVKEAYEHNHL